MGKKIIYLVDAEHNALSDNLVILVRSSVGLDMTAAKRRLRVF